MKCLHVLLARLTGAWFCTVCFLGISFAGPAVSQAPAKDQSDGSLQIPDRPEPLLLDPIPRFVVPYDSVRMHALDSGLRVVVVEDKSVPIVDVAFAFAVGSVAEGDSTPAGVLPMTSTLLRRGGVRGERAMDAATFDLALEVKGLEVRSFGGRHRSGVVASGPAEAFEALSSAVADVVLRPAFDPAQVERYRSAGLRSLQRRYGSSGAIAQRELEALIFGREHPRIRPLVSADIGRFQPATLRAAHQAHFRPELAVVAVAGPISAEKVFERFEALFGDWRGSEDPRPTPEIADPAPAKPGFYQVVREEEQGTLLIGRLGAYRTSWSDRRADTVQLLSEILSGDGAVSRLRARLRDRDGLVYSVRGSIGIGAREPGLMQIGLQVDAERALETIAAALEEFERLRRVPIRTAELEVARRVMIGGLPSLFDTAEEIAGRYAEDLLLGRPHERWSTLADRLEAVTPAMLAREADRWLALEDLYVVWVGPQLRKSELDGLGFRRVNTLPERDPATLEVVRAGRR